MKNIIELADLGKKMRLSQAEYKRTNSSIAASESKRLEKDFDMAIDKILSPLVEVVPENQLNLL